MMMKREVWRKVGVWYLGEASSEHACGAVQAPEVAVVEWHDWAQSKGANCNTQWIGGGQRSTVRECDKTTEGREQREGGADRPGGGIGRVPNAQMVVLGGC